MIFARDSLVETPVNMKWFNCAISNFKGGKIPKIPSYEVFTEMRYEVFTEMRYEVFR